MNRLSQKLIVQTCLKKAHLNNGFTLIELLVVIIIIGILAAVSLPNFLGQIGKSRETEAKTNLGGIARSQQAYHFEKQVFADTLTKLSLNGNFTSNYYDPFAPSDVSNLSIRVKHQAVASDPLSDRVRDYAIAVYYNAGLFNIAFCQGADVDVDVEAPDTPGGACTNGGIRIE